MKKICGRFRLGLVAGLVILTLPCAARSAGLFGPKTFDECVLARIHEIKTDFAMRFLVAACRRQFPTEPTTTDERRKAIDRFLDGDNTAPDRGETRR